jgi:CRP/FNR family transcriptional regulator
MDPTAQALRRVTLFSSLSDDALARVARVAFRRTCAPGETVIFEGDPCQAAYFIAEGQVRVYRLSPGGREQVLARLGPGQAFNTVPPFQPQGINHATVQALTAATLYVVTCGDFRRLVEECGELALAIVQDFADRLDHLANLVEDLSLRTVRGRLARFLLEHASTARLSASTGLGEAADAVQVARNWTQDEIAAHLGTVRDMVGRTLRAFADAGLVRIERQRILLLDRDGLEAEAQR